MTSLGLGASFVPMTLGTVSAVAHQDTGIVSALLNTDQQIGGALGLAVLSTIATSAANDKVSDAAATLYRGLAARDFGLVARAAEAPTCSCTMVFTAAAAMFLAGLVITALAIHAQRQYAEDADPRSIWADPSDGTRCAAPSSVSPAGTWTPVHRVRLPEAHPPTDRQSKPGKLCTPW
ncbi:hypothetical protein ACFV2H_34380 [Streptomyces sp. NPDC059629]|uniref:hypothetical protein n=1 Tax=Streptomyces sp. NPDC059629 TaxID=3346889 RepID=UPI0036A66754